MLSRYDKQTLFQNMRWLPLILSRVCGFKTSEKAPNGFVSFFFSFFVFVENFTFQYLLCPLISRYFETFCFPLVCQSNLCVINPPVRKYYNRRSCNLYYIKGLK